VPDILHQLTITAPREQVYAALTQAPLLARWWTTDVAAQACVGAIAEFGFTQRAMVIRLRIDELVPGQRVRWTCVGGIDEWIGTEIAFFLVERGAATVLSFAHRGWTSSSSVFATCSFDWARDLISLRDLLESGQGRPHAAK
jgi:uncharacterized protein YndB with AHSA1/START domain